MRASMEMYRASLRSMMIALPSRNWHSFASVAVDTFALTLKDWATEIDLKRFKSSHSVPKKPNTKAKFDPKHPHVATARILKQKQNKRSPK